MTTFDLPLTDFHEARARIAARVMGTVVQVAVREGDAVRQGQLLVQLDERELGARRARRRRTRTGRTWSSP